MSRSALHRMVQAEKPSKASPPRSQLLQKVNQAILTLNASEIVADLRAINVQAAQTMKVAKLEAQVDPSLGEETLEGLQAVARGIASGSNFEMTCSRRPRLPKCKRPHDDDFDWSQDEPKFSQKAPARACTAVGAPTPLEMSMSTSGDGSKDWTPAGQNIRLLGQV
ncbi:hypothetical protein WJX84_005004 [Apatococcus fuscideae]|uniref:Uncharacterized protein n=1 Tax=Apatococcus fuscideae TaxID=2026836 RepID=A0AAW1SST0_9CHLO